MFNNSVYLTELEMEYRRQEAIRQAEMDHLARLARGSRERGGRLSLLELLRQLMGQPAKPALALRRVQRPEIVRRQQPQQQCC